MRHSPIAFLIATALCLLALPVTGATAAPPVISGIAVTGVTTTSATLEADINPEGKGTLYRFEYGSAPCSLNPCTSIPVPEGKVAPADVPVGKTSVRVKQNVTGLTPATTYHFRVVAKNGDGPTNGPDRTFSTHSPTLPFPPCPNDHFRTEENPTAAFLDYLGQNLPDCRAYEQASPVEKNAGDVSGAVTTVKAALSGGGITFNSSSGIPGGEGSQDMPLYLAGRGAGQWSTQGLLPPGDTGQRARVLGWTPDVSKVYLQSIKFGTPHLTTLLVRDAATGAVEPVVDYTPAPPALPPEFPFTEFHFAGASPDGSVLLFESNAELLPGAVEAKSNVYLWEEASGELSLVSVMNEGAAPPKGAFAGPYDWNKGTTPSSVTEGGSARSYYTPEQNVISDDGSAAYFTAAGSGRLFLRQNPTEPQSPVNGEGECTDPAKACTVEVSATQRSVPDPAGTRPAAFMGASADGTKSFFTSSEKLTGDANTGPDQLVAIGRAEIDGDNPDQDFLTARGLGVAVDATHIYWANPATGTIGRAKLNGEDADNEFIEAASSWGVAVDATHIYWANGPAGAIGRAELNGDGPATEVEEEYIQGAGNPRGVAVDGTHIYWTNSAVDSSSSAFIGRAKLDGSDIEPEFIEVINLGKTLTGISVNATHIYWLDTNTSNESRISRAQLDGNIYILTCTFLGEKPVAGEGIALDATHIYWAEQASGTIGRDDDLDCANFEPDEPEFIETENPQGLAVNASHIFWSANAESPPNPGNDLYRYDAESGLLSDVAVDTVATAGIAVQGVIGISDDGSRVYFAANGVPPGVANTPNANGEAATPGDCKGPLGTASGTCNLYLWEEGEGLTFIARLQAGGAGKLTDAANWAATTAGIFSDTNFQKSARITPDGGTLLFRSQRQLSDYVSEGAPQFYRYRVGDGAPSCVSCNPTGASPVAQPSLGSIFPSVLVPPDPASMLAHNLSADGSRVFFETADALVTSDTNGLEGCPPSGSALQNFPACLDVYVWEAQGTGSCKEDLQGGGCLYLLSTGKGKEPALLADASGSGDDAYFFTRARLVGQDQDALIDVYDARVEGGLTAQNQPPAPPCGSIEDCHDPSQPQPPIESPGSASFVGPADKVGKKPGRVCPKGKRSVRVKGKRRCVAKGKAKRKKARRANSNRRASR